MGRYGARYAGVARKLVGKTVNKRRFVQQFSRGVAGKSFVDKLIDKTGASPLKAETGVRFPVGAPANSSNNLKREDRFVIAVECCEQNSKWALNARNAPQRMRRLRGKPLQRIFIHLEFQEAPEISTNAKEVLAPTRLIHSGDVGCRPYDISHRLGTGGPAMDPTNASRAAGWAAPKMPAEPRARPRGRVAGAAAVTPAIMVGFKTKS